MSSEHPAIRVRNLGKKYQLGGPQEKYATLRDAIVRTVSAPFRRGSVSPVSDFWALKDVSFDIEQGEVVGIIGRNGAGKSTLLKILSRITTPTEGSVELYGRVGSLLEVGTGFHPELTGRENIYLSGSILGMKKREIDAKLDEIVKFSEIEKFLDTPAKRYSSGMYVRLAFAVAAHLEPEILLVDEVLAVGDAAFQKKCLGKMGEVAKEGRTVLFVSHNMAAISRLCKRCILFDQGLIEEDNESSIAIQKYLIANLENKCFFSQEGNDNVPMCLLEASISSDSENNTVFSRSNAIKIKIRYKVNHKISSAHVYSNIISSNGIVVFGTSDCDMNPDRFGVREKGFYSCSFEIPAELLNEDVYTVSISLGIPYQQNFQENNYILRFSVINFDKSQNAIHRKRMGIIYLNIPWIYSL